MSESDHPERGIRTLLEDAHHVFMEGHWESLGISDPGDLRVRDRIRRYTSQGRAVPSHLVYHAARVWDLNKARIVREWEDALDEAWAAQDSSDFRRCATCPACGCPGMG